jgi:hypothetical protein
MSVLSFSARNTEDKALLLRLPEMMGCEKPKPFAEILHQDIGDTEEVQTAFLHLGSESIGINWDPIRKSLALKRGPATADRKKVQRAFPCGYQIPITEKRQATAVSG